MRQVQLQEAEHQFASLIAEAEGGQTLTILRGDRPVAQIIAFPHEEAESEAERLAALDRLTAIMDHGYDFGGVKITSRDELYDRE